MASLLDARCDCLLLPRPWLEIQLSRAGQSPVRQPGLFIRGDALVGGRVIRLPYWHKLVNIKKTQE